MIIGFNNGHPIVADLFYKDSVEQKAVVIYAHGFNGFKDWGNFDLIAEQFAWAGFVFVKVNFSHNGTTSETPEAFSDLDAFGNNNYTKQLDDLQQVIEWTQSDILFQSAEKEKIYLIGHSMGGGICIIKSAEELRVKKLATWASIAECKTPWGLWPEEKLHAWKTEGVQYYFNARTQQQMPLYYQLYEDYMQHQQRLDIKAAMKSLRIPVLVAHGSKDEAVPIAKAYELHQANPSASLFVVESDHVFGRKHPWNEKNLPQPMQDVVNATIHFFKAAND